ncbi:hypothetical protein [Halomonas sp. DQ26W]|uniref:hypothetical protein n=1 Tax=Halomonas sp. DQ26W TaxID=2282311 RepID=UPI0011C02B2A|nr:hypothetical protein [Halomonas sp. DQ26W]
MDKSGAYRVNLAIILSIFISLLALAFYFIIGKAVLEGESNFQFYADSLTYEKLYFSNYFSSIHEMVGFGGNYLGPLLILELFNGNRLAILFLNCCIFLVSVRIIVYSSNVRPAVFILLLILNPLTFFSLISVNKEIISLLVCACFTRWLFSRWVGWILLAFLISFLVRWQLAFFILFAYLSFSNFNLLRNYRLLFLAFVLLSISMVYYSIFGVFENVNAVALAGAESNDGIGLYSFFNQLQSQGFYFIVFIPKTLQAMFGLAPNIVGVLSPENIYNDVIITLNAFISFVVFCFLIISGRFILKNDMVFVFLLYCVIFTLSPIYSPRYFFSAYVFMAIALASRSKSRSELR